MNLNEAGKRVFDWNVEAGHIDLSDPAFRDCLYEDRDKRGLALDLIQEELDELQVALVKGSEVDTLDAICDILFTTLGVAAKAGLHNVLDEAFEEVCRSNDSKLVGLREILLSGKLGKGSEYSPPDLHKILLGE